MRPLTSITSCLEVTDQDIRDALAPARSFHEPGPRARTMALVQHMAKIARPGAGAPKILIVLAHMATHDWLEGELEVKLVGDHEVSVLELFVDVGFGRERFLGPSRIDAPLRELADAVRAHPHVIEPLVAAGPVTDRRVELRTTQALRMTSAPPSFSAVSASLLPISMGAGRALPQIVSSPPPELLEVPEVAEPPAPAPEARRAFKPLSLPPHLKEALAPSKKK